MMKPAHGDERKAIAASASSAGVSEPNWLTSQFEVDRKRLHSVPSTSEADDVVLEAGLQFNHADGCGRDNSANVSRPFAPDGIGLTMAACSVGAAGGAQTRLWAGNANETPLALQCS